MKAGKKNALTHKFWYQIKAPALLRKFKADLYFSAFYSAKTSLPQCIIINDPLFLNHPGLFKKKQVRSGNKQLSVAAAKAKAIITLSAHTKNILIEKFSAAAGKTDTIYNGVPIMYKEYTEGMKEEIKRQYTEGKEFFFCMESFYGNGNLINLLKAFSFFKKRQQSNFQLIIYRRSFNGDPSFASQLEKYKYRADVKIIDNGSAPEPGMILSAAYACIHPVFTDDFCFSVAAAMRMGIPVITSAGTAMQEITAGSSLYVHPGEPQQVAESIMRVYKDENLRNELIEKGRKVVAGYTTERTAEELWHVIRRCFD